MNSDKETYVLVVRPLNSPKIIVKLSSPLISVAPVDWYNYYAHIYIVSTSMNIS